MVEQHKNPFAHRGPDLQLMQNMVASISHKEWELHKRQILGLYVDQNYPLRLVQTTLAKQGFNASESQYRTRFKTWKVRKIKKGRPGEKRTENEAAVADPGAAVSPYSNADADSPAPPGSLPEEPAIHLERRDHSSLASSHPLTAYSYTGRADGNGMRDFEERRPNEMSSMAHGLNDSWIAAMQREVDAVTRYMADPFWSP